MLVKLPNDWFDGQAYHKKGVAFEYNGLESALPTGALVISEAGTLPVGGNTPKPGFGAKPLEEQILDMVGASDNHQTAIGQVDLGITPAPKPSLQDGLQAQADAEAEREKARGAQQEQHDKELAELQQSTDKALEQAHDATKVVTEAIDPLFAAKTDDAPAKPKDAKAK